MAPGTYQAHKHISKVWLIWCCCKTRNLDAVLVMKLFQRESKHSLWHDLSAVYHLGSWWQRIAAAHNILHIAGPPRASAKVLHVNWVAQHGKKIPEWMVFQVVQPIFFYLRSFPSTVTAIKPQKKTMSPDKGSFPSDWLGEKKKQLSVGVNARKTHFLAIFCLKVQLTSF